MKPSATRMLLPILVMFCAVTACKRKDDTLDKAAYIAESRNALVQTVNAYRKEIRQFYDQRQFDKLETRSHEARATKAKFGNGYWKLHHFYNELLCGDDAPESAWQMHERIFQDWEKAFPNSITARVAHANFLTSYAWHARGSGYANQVTKEGWRLFNERLAAAATILTQARNLPEKCPVWWEVGMTVALGQSWSKADFGKFFEEAKAFEPQYFMYDLAQASFLLPRWHGKAGDWEAAAEKEIDRPGGLGLEGYARVANEMSKLYNDFFGETKVSWSKVRQGFEIMHARYPDSAMILNNFARLACAAKDRELAKSLFAEIGSNVMPSCWGGTKQFEKMKRWATD